jgi:hypothetical protein
MVQVALSVPERRLPVGIDLAVEPGRVMDVAGPVDGLARSIEHAGCCIERVLGLLGQDWPEVILDVPGRLGRVVENVRRFGTARFVASSFGLDDRVEFLPAFLVIVRDRMERRLLRSGGLQGRKPRIRRPLERLEGRPAAGDHGIHPTLVGRLLNPVHARPDVGLSIAEALLLHLVHVALEDVELVFTGLFGRQLVRISIDHVLGLGIGWIVRHR